VTGIQKSTAGQCVRADELSTSFVQLYVTDDASVAAAFDHLRRVENRLDVLVNNAGIYATGVGTADLTAKDSLKEFDTNVVGGVRVTQAALPMLRRSTNAGVVNLSSGQGSFSAAVVRCHRATVSA
jgi:NAD(P)-dependent dehydrogenase (short-subunit alcohol dehydrogenase family)